MFLFKLIYHVNSLLKIFVYKIVFGKKISIPWTTSFRSGFHLAIEEHGKIVIGKDCFFNNYCSIFSRCSVSIGDGTIFGENVKIYDHNHRFSDLTRLIKNQGYKSASINIGKHCWIGSNVVVLKGVTIGDNCVIGAGCVIVKSVPSGSVVVNEQNLLRRSISAIS